MILFAAQDAHRGRGFPELSGDVEILNRPRCNLFSSWSADGPNASPGQIGAGDRHGIGRDCSLHTRRAPRRGSRLRNCGTPRYLPLPFPRWVFLRPSSADRNAKVGLNQSGGIIDAVADHRHREAPCLDVTDLRGLLFEQDLRPALVGGRRFWRRPCVAGEHHALDAHFPKALDSVERLLAHHVLPASAIAPTALQTPTLRFAWLQYTASSLMREIRLQTQCC